MKGILMKFSRLSNAFLDIGMLLILCGQIASVAVVIGMIPSDPYGFNMAVMTLVLGIVFYLMSAWLSKFRKPPSDTEFAPPKIGLKLVVISRKPDAG